MLRGWGGSRPAACLRALSPGVPGHSCAPCARGQSGPVTPPGTTASLQVRPRLPGRVGWAAGGPGDRHPSSVPRSVTAECKAASPKARKAQEGGSSAVVGPESGIGVRHKARRFPVLPFSFCSEADARPPTTAGFPSPAALTPAAPAPAQSPGPALRGSPCGGGERRGHLCPVAPSPSWGAPSFLTSRSGCRGAGGDAWRSLHARGAVSSLHPYSCRGRADALVRP